MVPDVLLLEPVGERGRGGLVDDAQDFEPGDLAGVLGRLALAVVEIGRHGDDRLGDGLAQIGLGGFLHLLQHEGADLGGRVFLAAALDPGVAVVAGNDLEGHQLHLLLHHRIDEAAADHALDAVKGVLGVGDGLAFGRLADQALARFREGDHGGRRARALAVLDHLGLLAFHDGDAGIGGAEIDADDFGHIPYLLVSGTPAAQNGAAPAPHTVPHYPRETRGYIWTPRPVCKTRSRPKTALNWPNPGLSRHRAGD